MSKIKTVILLSGGLDSTVLAYYLKSQGHQLFPIAFDYEQKHAIELKSSKKIAKKLGVELKIVPLDALGDLAPCALTRSNISVPHAGYQDEIQKATVVPNRNMVMLSLAVSYATSIGAKFVAIATHFGDAAIYPDCRIEFIEAFNETLRAQELEVRVMAPFINIDKSNIVEVGKSLRVPFDSTYSCYEGEEIPCGKCGACIERNEAMNRTNQKL